MAKEAREAVKKKRSDFSSARYFINKNLSLLAFDGRVLAQAIARENPTIDKFKFLAISATNLDEFFMVKIGAVYDDLEIDRYQIDDSGLTPQQVLTRISTFAHDYVRRQYEIYDGLTQELKNATGVEFCKVKTLTGQEKSYIENYFFSYIYPALTPLAVDASRPFPLVQSRTINIGLVVSVNGEERFATVQMPITMPRLIKTSGDSLCKRYVFMEDVIINYLGELFTGCDIRDVCPYRITRDADFAINDEKSVDVLREIEVSIRKRQWGETMRLEVGNGSSKVVEVLKTALAIEDNEVYIINGPISLAFCMTMGDIVSGADLQYSPFVPAVPQELQREDIYSLVQKKDILLHHPYESFQPVIDFVLKAANDPSVLAIKQTLYRVSGNSPIVGALAQAAENGKQVTVLLEVKARFDEENNIHWAKRLERAGCHVIYGLVGFKTHCKITLVVRLEDGVIKRYMHFGTGNYNDVTARLYTDLSLFTANETLGADATAVFNMLTGFSQRTALKSLVMAPHNLRSTFARLIKRETENALAGKEAHIIAKVNGLTDTGIIQELYVAAAAGVKIELIVRGMCSLRPDPDQSFIYPIKVISIVGRFLEHSRLFYFKNAGNEEVFMSSADFMPRNLDQRVELLTPIFDAGCKARVMDMLKILLSDNVKARQLRNDCSYVRIEDGKKMLDSQAYFLASARKELIAKEAAQSTLFIPIQGIPAPGKKKDKQKDEGK